LGGGYGIVLVLVVDADLSASTSARSAIERFGYRCETAADFEGAKAAVAALTPDVVLFSLQVSAAAALALIAFVRADERARAAYVVALVDVQDGEGVLLAMSAGADDFLVRPWHDEQLHARLQVAERVALVNQQLDETRAALERARRAVTALARTDPLTSLWNRPQLNEDLNLFQGQLARYGHQYAIATLDLDRFGAYNAKHGQLAGDEALRVVAGEVVRQLRTGDRAYRFDGDALVLLLPEQTRESALIAAERIRESIHRLMLPHPGNSRWAVVTVSVGVAAFGDDVVDSYDDLMHRAEAALARAKADGGNRVVFAD
jgi:two-component system, cell cycle response regulator